MQFRNIPSAQTALVIAGAMVLVVFETISFMKQQDSTEQFVEAPAVPATTQLSALEQAVNWPEATLPVSERGDVYVGYSGNPKDPRILEVALDPLDAQVGEEQVITVKTREKGAEITRDNTAAVEVVTDNASEIVPLKLKKIEEPDLTITWQGTWLVDDTHTALYSAVVTAANASNRNSVTLSLK